MEFISDVTKQDIEDMVIEVMSDDGILQDIQSSGFRFNITRVDDDFFPDVKLICDSSYAEVEFETQELVEDDIVVGFKFVPTVTVSCSITMDERNSYDVVELFVNSGKAAQICRDIYLLDFYPYEFFD